jgi:hypothetical protein
VSNKPHMRVAPENYWRNVFHDDCSQRGGGIMKRYPHSLTIEDGSKLQLFECLHCGERCYAGLNAGRHVTVREVPAEHQNIVAWEVKP